MHGDVAGLFVTVDKVAHQAMPIAIEVNADQLTSPVVQLMALPIKVAGVEAAPSRAVVFDGWPDL